MNTRTMKLTGNIPDDIRAFRRFCNVDAKTARTMLNGLYKVPYGVRRVVLSDLQIAAYDAAVKENKLPKGFRLDVPVDIDTTFDLTPYERRPVDVSYDNPSKPVDRPQYWETYRMNRLFEVGP